MNYDPHAIEKKWREKWEQHPDAVTRPISATEKKFYCLDMFPYPSGAGLHMGHWRSYVLSDLYARAKWLEGYNVLHPMGYDAFGSPAENDAIKKKIHPRINVERNIANFRRQLKEVGCLFDWSKELDTTDPDYYKWTQWIFLKMYKAGLAYRANRPINWCPSCKTGIANEEVINGGCERCGAKVVQKQMPQWMLRITDYAEKLLHGLDRLDWPERVKLMQRNWIGKSVGCLVQFHTQDHHGDIVELPVFTTRPDTLCGVTYLVIAPELKCVLDIVTPEQLEPVRAYRNQVTSMTSFERQLDKEKNGVFTGAYATCPLTDAKVPVYIASYVLPDYGTGIVMAVPAHDVRDFEFAIAHHLPIKQVIDHKEVKKDVKGTMLEAYVGDGVLINSGVWNGLDARTEGVKKITQYLEQKGLGKRDVNYKLRDWIFSRQRYWGEPIPLIHCPVCGTVPVPEDQLPVLLPDVEHYEPTGTGESPLAAIVDWVNTACPNCKGPAQRETNTMPQWAGSCWYFLRYPDPQLRDKPWHMKDLAYWLPVDLYVGGIEHAILHLLYARFYVKVLADLGYVSFDEPFTRLFNQGMILKYSEKSGLIEKMSKSKGNVVNPDDVVAQYGADALRLYIMFIGPADLDCVWQDNGLEGMRRFLIKLWNYFTAGDVITSHEEASVKQRVHVFLHDFQTRLHNFKPNTAISALMEFLNDATENNMRLSAQSAQDVLASLSIFVPHIASELLERVLHKRLAECRWPTYDQKLVTQKPIEIAVQINGKLRCTVSAHVGESQDVIVARAQQAAAQWLAEKKIVNTVFVADRLVNFVVR